jgi:DNA polymerase III sliding clamp (beta) subunit (PCNA family)
MNLNTANLMVGKAASTDPMRVGLQSIHVTATHTEATNGHILARVSLPFQHDCEELPLSIKTENAEYIEPFTIPAKAAMSIKLFKSKGNIPCLSDSLYVDVEKTNMNGTARFMATDRETTIMPELNKIDGDFPDIDRAIPTPDADHPPYHTRLNIAYLETLLAIAKSIGSEFITLDGGTKYVMAPVVLTAKTDNQTFTGVIMPCRE